MRRRLMPAIAATAVAALGLAWTGSAAQAAAPADELVALCEELYGDTFGTPNTEPLGACQWDMALINAGTETGVNP